MSLCIRETMMDSVVHQHAAISDIPPLEEIRSEDPFGVHASGSLLLRVASERVRIECRIDTYDSGKVERNAGLSSCRFDRLEQPLGTLPVPLRQGRPEVSTRSLISFCNGHARRAEPLGTRLKVECAFQYEIDLIKLINGSS